MGERAANTKLTVTKVMLLKKLLNQNKPVRQLIKQFKITDMQVYRIKPGENWKHVPAAELILFTFLFEVVYSCCYFDFAAVCFVSVAVAAAFAPQVFVVEV